MEFNQGSPIYEQIADRIRENILRNMWSAEERIPSIREMAVETEVNPNTVTRTYSLLQDQGIIYNRRGIGYFVAEDAEETTRMIMKEEFLRNELPQFFRKLELLGLKIEDIAELYHKEKERSHEKQQ